METSKSFYCFVARPQKHKEKSFCSSTDNLKLTMDQLNGKVRLPDTNKFDTVKMKSSPWEYYIVITGFSSQEEANACAFRLKHPTLEKKRPKMFNGVSGRVKALNIVLGLDTWTEETKEEPGIGIKPDRSYTLYLNSLYFDSVDKKLFKENITLKNIDELIT